MSYWDEGWSSASASALPSGAMDANGFPSGGSWSALPSGAMDPNGFASPSWSAMPSGAMDPNGFPSPSAWPSGAMDPNGFPSPLPGGAMDPNGFPALPWGAMNPGGFPAPRLPRGAMNPAGFPSSYGGGGGLSPMLQTLFRAANQPGQQPYYANSAGQPIRRAPNGGALQPAGQSAATGAGIGSGAMPYLLAGAAALAVAVIAARPRSAR